MNLTTKDAVISVLEGTRWSKYKLAQELGVRPIMISNYLKQGTKMGKATAERFTAKFDITISDIYLVGTAHEYRTDKK